jgi:hypothetical protein
MDMLALPSIAVITLLLVAVVIILVVALIIWHLRDRMRSLRVKLKPKEVSIEIETWKESHWRENLLETLPNDIKEEVIGRMQHSFVKIEEPAEQDYRQQVLTDWERVNQFLQQAAYRGSVHSSVFECIDIVYTNNTVSDSIREQLLLLYSGIEEIEDNPNMKISWETADIVQEVCVGLVSMFYIKLNVTKEQEQCETN